MPKIVIATKHKKAPLVAPALEPLGFEVFTTDLFDTDTLGMFSHEVQRHCSANTAALTKAQRACELTDEQFGLGSEGTSDDGMDRKDVEVTDTVIHHMAEQSRTD